MLKYKHTQRSTSHRSENIMSESLQETVQTLQKVKFKSNHHILSQTDLTPSKGLWGSRGSIPGHDLRTSEDHTRYPPHPIQSPESLAGQNLLYRLGWH